MRASKFLVATVKETPADAVIVSHQLMLRAGMVRKVASGLYSWLPTGLRTLRKVEKIVREEMDRAGALEVLMPCIQPAEVWQQTGRFDQMGGEMLKMQDRHGRDFVFGPTHEEIITELAKNEISSYKQLPITMYQIQTKFRDEFRPRFGVVRAREFTMKDAYSFHINQDCLQTEYDNMHAAYCRIFDRLGLDYRPVQADTGAIGGSASHEFQVLADSGEDYIAFSNDSDFAANIEMAEAICTDERAAPSEDKRTIDTPNAKTIAELVEQFEVDIKQTLKTIFVVADEDSEHDVVALVLRGDHELNDIKAEKLAGVKAELEMATDAQVLAATGAKPGSCGPIGLNIPVYVDRAAAVASDFVIGANEDGKHFFGVNWERDVTLGNVADLRNVVEGDPSPCGKGTIVIKKGIEVGHIFQLGGKYAEALGASVLNEQGKDQTMIMGCYGIGTSRIVAAAIEQNHDDNGIIWPAQIAPFHVGIVPLNAHKSEEVTQVSERIYNELAAQGIEVYLDDRDKKTSPGKKFADMELMGLPHRIVVSDRGLKEGKIEYQARTDSEKQAYTVEEVIELVSSQVKSALKG